MKLYLEEEEIDADGSKSYKKIKVVKDKAEAKKDKAPNPKKSWFHTCYHDEDKPSPCTREAL